MQGKTPKGSWNLAAAMATEELLAKCLETMPDITALSVMSRDGDLLAVTGPARKALLQNAQFSMGMFGLFGAAQQQSEEIEFNISRTPVGDLLAGCIDGKHIVFCLTLPRSDVERALADLEWLAERVERVFEDS